MRKPKRSRLSRHTPLEDMPERLTVDEYAQANGVGKSTVYDAVARGTLPAIRIGKRVFIPRETLKAS